MDTPIRITVVGTGYVGLTTAVALAYLGHSVCCLDVDEKKVEALQNGMPVIYEPGLAELLALARPRLHFTTSYAEAVPNADVVFVTVGTPVGADGYANLDYVAQAAESIGRHLGDHFTLVVNKSTVPIGCGNWVDALVRDAYYDEHRRRIDGCLGVASNPEFLKEGTALHDTFYPDRIVIGAERPEIAERLARVYRPILDQQFTPPPGLPRPAERSTVPLVTTDLASAELIKYTANAFLALKISFINEIGRLAEKVGADIVEVARGIGLDQRIGNRFLQAGLGWGGSCFGKDISCLVATGREYGFDLSIVDAARRANCRQRERVVEKLLEQLKILKGRRIGLLGLAFKPDTDDVRDAPALDIARRLRGHGAKVLAHDPQAHAQVSGHPDTASLLQLVDEPGQVFEGADAVVLVTEWPEYQQLPYEQLRAAMKTPLFVDGRNALNRDAMSRYGYQYQGMGR